MKMKEPGLFNPDSFDGTKGRTKRQLNNGSWVLARSERLESFSFKWRLKLALGVFTGKYDALYWIEDEKP